MATAAAVVGASVIGSQSSKSAANKAAGASKAASFQIQKAASDAREDVLNLFPSSQQSLLEGSKAALDVYARTIPEQQSFLRQGNLGAQNTTSQGFNQAQAALLGLPISGFNVSNVVSGLSPANNDVQLPVSGQNTGNVSGQNGSGQNNVLGSFPVSSLVGNPDSVVNNSQKAFLDKFFAGDPKAFGARRLGRWQ